MIARLCANHHIHYAEALVYTRKHNLNTDYVLLLDYSIPSGTPRLFVWDYNRDKVVARTYVMHGVGGGSTAKEPVFSNKSHGFRPNRSCQTALMQIQKTFTGTNWFVEGDIHACFDSFDHHIVIEILRRRIEDEAFIQLIWKFLKAGYMEQWEYERTYSGVPQGSGVSPVLCNIYLNELDKFMEQYATELNTKAPRKRLSPAYKTSVNRAYEYRREGKKLWDQLMPEEKKDRSRRLKEMERAEKSMTPTIPLDTNYKRIQYTRYADDFIIGVIGSKEDAEQVKRDVKTFLQEKMPIRALPYTVLSVRLKFL